MLTRAFGVKEWPFTLKVAQWRDLEKARDCGLGVVAQRLAPLVDLKKNGFGAPGLLAAISAGYLGDARLDDVRDPILYGLIGGGMTSTEAGGLVRNVFDETVNAGSDVMLHWCDLAFNIITYALLGLADEPDEDSLGE